MCKCRSHGTFPLFGLQSSHLNICYYHQDPHRRPLRPGLTPKVSAQFGTVTRLPVHPASPVLLTKNGPLGALDSVARLNEAAVPSYLFKSDERFDTSVSLRASTRVSSGFAPLRHSSPSFGVPDRHAHTRTLLRKSRSVGGATPLGGSRQSASLRLAGLLTRLTRTHVRLLGPCFKTGRMGCPQAGAGSTQGYIAETARAANHDRRDGISTSHIDSSGFGRRTNPHRSTPRVDRRTGYRRSTSDRGRIAGPHSLPSRQFQALFDSLFKVLFIFPSRGLGPGPPLEDASPDYNSDSEAARFQAGLIPVRSPLLRESLRHIGVFIKGPPVAVEASSQDDTLGSSSRASLTAHDARHNTRVFSTTTSRASTEGDSSLGQPHHKHGRPISAPMPCVPIRGAWLGRRDA
ncbi:hypothetical protein L2E82_53597 [Cichorium intybus]|nr:hypothetical protein L2E82_53597 [Cichorium intybus]